MIFILIRSSIIIFNIISLSRKLYSSRYNYYLIGCYRVDNFSTDIKNDKKALIA